MISLDFIFSFLPVIVIFLVVFGKISKIINQLISEPTVIDEQQSQIKETEAREKHFEEESQNRKVSKNEMEDKGKRLNSLENKVNKKDNEILTKEINPKDKSSFRKEKIGVEQDTGLMKKKERESIFEEELSEKDIIRGVVFKEILDKPRAKNPYHPPYIK